MEDKYLLAIQAYAVRNIGQGKSPNEVVMQCLGFKGLDYIELRVYGNKGSGAAGNLKQQIEALQAENKRLREALEVVDNLWESFPSYEREVKACKEFGGDSPILIVWKKIKSALQDDR